jgi:hypothetical protein
MTNNNEHVVAPSVVALGLLKECVASDTGLDRGLKDAFLTDLAGAEPHEIKNLLNHISGASNEAGDDNNQ